MRGLDPRIHQKNDTKKMDCRVKPGNDDLALGCSHRIAATVFADRNGVLI